MSEGRPNGGGRIGGLGVKVRRVCPRDRPHGSGRVRRLDERAVRHRRLRLGLTETYLGSLCGVSASVMCRLESGWPQDDLSARFITLLADRLGCTVGDLLAAPYPEPIDDSQAEAGPDDCRQFGAILHAADRPVPTDALGHALGCDLPRLEAATLGLAQLPEAAGATVVDGGAALAVVDDLAACDRDTFDRAGRTAFALRRSSLPELRVVHQVATAQRVRWAARSGLPVRGAGPALALAVT